MSKNSDVGNLAKELTDAIAGFVGALWADGAFNPPPIKPKSWFEAGHLPPVGTICEYAIEGERWWPCEIRYVVGSNGVVMWVPHLEKEQYCSAAKTGFRPIRTERDKFIDAAVEAVGGSQAVINAHVVLGKLFDAGFKAPEQQ